MVFNKGKCQFCRVVLPPCFWVAALLQWLPSTHISHWQMPNTITPYWLTSKSNISDLASHPDYHHSCEDSLLSIWSTQRGTFVSTHDLLLIRVFLIDIHSRVVPIVPGKKLGSSYRCRSPHKPSHTISLNADQYFALLSMCDWGLDQHQGNTAPC